jgi:hypothetical protein
MGSCVAAPASAPAGTLLSGYGGPGQGNQAILGSTLLNGPSNGGSGGSGAAGHAGAGPVSSAAAPSGQGREGSSAAKYRHPAARGKPTENTVAAASEGKPSAYQAYLRATSQAASNSGTLGLSGSQLLFVLLGLAALLSAGLLTRGLARGSGTGKHAGN